MTVDIGGKLLILAPTVYTLPHWEALNSFKDVHSVIKPRQFAGGVFI